MDAPDDFARALAKVTAAQAAWDALPPSHRKAYLDWIAGAKKPETRARRIEKALAMIREKKRP